MEQTKDILKKYWGYDAFRPLQEEIIASVLVGKDTLALLPTGGGKSICFQVPGLMLEGLCLVISPLIALMMDQVQQLKKRGISAAAVTSGMPKREIDILLDNCVYGKVKFLYVSPERLKSDLFIERLKKMEVGLLAVDEAHCISQWGYDFRPSYVEIASIYDYLSDTKKIALTATATADVSKDICEKLNFKEPTIFQKSFARANLSYSAFELENKGPKLIDILNNVKGSAIVYVKSRLETQNVAKYLYQHGISSDFYHAGLDPVTRNKKQEEWIKNTRRVMVATNAFGMGIDKPDVRVVVHLDLPDSLEAYYQEAGRAGRDERNAFAVLLYNPSDLFRLSENEKHRNPTLDYVQRVYQAIANYFKLATGSSQWQSYDFDLKQFAATYQLNPREAHFCIQKLEEMGLLLVSESLNKSSTVKFALDGNEVYKFTISNGAYEPVIKSMLRLYGGGLYADFTNVSEFEVAKLSKHSKGEVIKKLQLLEQQGVIVYDPMKTLPQLTYLTPRLEVSALKKFYNEVAPRHKVIKEKVEAMKAYAVNKEGCRTRIFQEYFNEKTYLNCGVCDVCIKAKKQEKLMAALDQTKTDIMALVASGQDYIDELKEASEVKNDFVFTEAIRLLIDEGVVKMVGYDRLEVL
ncbi:ATP-dependent DNA helicase RecQ [Reichenbachiella faecimaris]|uniref:ATP-dependent DNA helicase RecQ n=1 Tax=Reichenbachiella faecimaris TaxID=692418 RepID=A0A1W2GNM7_REIFA|nr:ATP-dependent DNA helicase RecQ [Reichenbachiella faecimaris]SMD38269.1 ATP-dependent DNA helicase RecQ [Reichenbachiella faecimaris]